jgi:hypothetical protein
VNDGCLQRRQLYGDADGLWGSMLTNVAEAACDITEACSHSSEPEANDSPPNSSLSDPHAGHVESEEIVLLVTSFGNFGFQHNELVVKAM